MSCVQVRIVSNRVISCVSKLSSRDSQLTTAPGVLAGWIRALAFDMFLSLLRCAL